MPANVEIKARLRDVAETRRRAAALADGPARELRQDDTFFPAARGRLKLRTFGPGSGELIHYDRPDATGPKTSSYAIVRTDDPDGLRSLLAGALGDVGRVRKVRTLFLVGQTRVHIDRVEGLGDFLELEVVLAAGQAPEAGVRIARELMERLGVHDGDLVAGAYVDLLDRGAVGGTSPGR